MAILIKMQERMPSVHTVLEFPTGLAFGVALFLAAVSLSLY